ncbi:MAG: hypothetical protein AB4041_16120 [Microcystaceae cyanobacterium]
MNQEKQFIILISSVIGVVFLGSLLMLVASAKIAILGLLLLACCIFSFIYPRQSLWAFLIYLPFAGTVTYYVPGVVRNVGEYVTYNNALYGILHLAKDVFYFPALLAIVLKRRFLIEFIQKHKPIAIAVTLLAVTSFITLIGVNLLQDPLSAKDQPFLMGLIGLKIFVGYIPLILCGYYLMRNRQDVVWFYRIFTLLVVAACGLALIQYFFLVTGICPGNVNLPNPIDTKATLQARCFVGGSLLYNPTFQPNQYFQRLPGTFVSPWQWAWFLVSGSFITYAASFSDPSRIWRFIGWIGMFFVLGAALICGQWTAFLVVPTVFVVLMVVTERNHGKRWLKLAIIAVISAIAVTQIGSVQFLIEKFIQRWQYKGGPLSFALWQWDLVKANSLTLLGNGLGRASSVARRLGRIRLIEPFYAKILYEVGIAGVIAFMGVVATVTFQTFRSYLSLKSPSFRLISLTFCLFIFFVSCNIYYYPLAVDPVAVYYWLFAGVLLKLPEIEAETAQDTTSIPLGTALNPEVLPPEPIKHP